MLQSIEDSRPAIWEDDAVSPVYQLLEEATWNANTGTVTLSNVFHQHKYDATECEFSDREELVAYLEQVAMDGANTSMPFERGAPVFDLDYDSIAQEALDEYQDHMERIGWEL